MDDSILPVEILLLIAGYTKRVGRAGLFFSCRQMRDEIARVFTEVDGRLRIARPDHMEYKRLCYGAATSRGTKALDVLLAHCRLGDSREFRRVNYGAMDRNQDAMRLAYKHDNWTAIEPLIRWNKQRAYSHFPLVAHLHQAEQAHNWFASLYENELCRYGHIDPRDYCEFIARGGDVSFIQRFAPICRADKEYRYRLALQSPEVCVKLCGKFSENRVRKIAEIARTSRPSEGMIKLLRWLYTQKPERYWLMDYFLPTGIGVGR